jgi:hypothetical protein
LDAGTAQIQRQPCIVPLHALFEIQIFQNSGITKMISKHHQQQQHQNQLNQQQATNIFNKQAKKCFF